MNDPIPPDADSVPEPESTPAPQPRVFLGSPGRLTTTPVTTWPVRAREPDPPFWASGFFKFIVFLLVAGGAGGGIYYQFFWLYRLPQERDLTNLQGQSLHVNMLAHDDTLLKYTISGTETVRYLPLATLSPSDQDFIGKLSSTPLAAVPFYCTLTDSAGQETPVRLIAHNDNWAQCALIADGSTHYIPLSTLAPSDQAVIRLLPSGLSFNYPMNYVFTGAPRPGVNVQLLGRNDNTVEYLVLATGQKYFAAISELSPIDQSFVREFPPYIPDRPPATLDTGSNPEVDSPVSRAARNGSAANLPITPGMLNSLVIIKGDYSEGSGFIAKLHGEYFVVTNEHVLSGNRQFTVTGMDGSAFPTNGPLYGAIDYDVAILKIPDGLAKNYLEIMADPQTNAKAGDSVTVPGNSLGAGVPTQIDGQLVAVGPELVEVSAQLLHGISGSPIIDRPSGKVVGIATMSITYKINSDNSGIATDTRWFGYRVDNINPTSGWVKMDWARFRDEGLKVRNAVDLFTSLDAVLRNKSQADIVSQPVQSAIVDFQSSVNLASSRRNRQDVQAAFLTFNSKLRSLADGGTSGLVPSSLYPYHANVVKQLEDLRKFMDQAFEDNRRTFQNLVGNVQ